ncbi:MAG: DUF4340 domain-containing protein [Ruminococcaceae bacterium]|nr:DUF4340 domain-containing protein [Oscillospiraceae bacterium]
MSEIEKNLPPEEPMRAAPQAQGLSDIEAFASAATRAVEKPRRKHRRAAVLLSAAAAVAVLAGAVFALPVLFPAEEPEPEPEQPDTAVTLLDKELDADGQAIENPVRSVRITTALDDYTLALNEDNVWKLQGEDDLPLNTTAVEGLVDELLFVQAQDTVAADVADMSTYGLDHPTLTVNAVYADGAAVTLKLASMAVGNGYYLRVNEENTVYLMDATLAQTAMKQPEAYVSLSVVEAPSVSKDDANGTVMVKELSLTGAVRDNVVTTIRPKEEADGPEYENTSYLLTAPYKQATDSETATKVFAVTSITAEEAVALHPNAAQLAEYGLDTPHSVAKIVLGVFTSTTNEEGEVTEAGYYNERVHLVKLGKKTADGTAYYAMADTRDVIYRIHAEQLPWADKTYHDFTNKYLFLRNLTSLQSITCTTGGKTYAFEFTHTPEGETLDDELTVKLNGETLRTHEFRVLYQVLMTLYRTGAAPAEPQGEPMLTVRVSSLDEKLADRVIDIYAHSGSVCIARTETGDTYKMTASRVIDAIEQIENYVSGDDVINRF